MLKLIIPILAAILILAIPAAFAENGNGNEIIIAGTSNALTAGPATNATIANTANATYTKTNTAPARAIAPTNEIANAQSSSTDGEIVHAILRTSGVADRGGTILLATNHDASLSQAANTGVICATNASLTFIQEAQPAFTAPHTKALGNSSTFVAMTATGHTEGGYAANTAAGKVPIRA